MEQAKLEQPLYPITQPKRNIIEYAKDIYRMLRKEIVYNLVYYPYANFKFQRLNKSVARSQEHTYTAFFRSPGQISAILGPVLKYIQNNSERNVDEVLQINIVAGSIGAEAYTIASTLLKKHPQLQFQIHCSDLHQHTIAKSRSAEYALNEVVAEDVPEQFIRDTFDRIGDSFKVKTHIREKVTFFEADIVNDNLKEKYPAGDLIFIQNVLFHLNTSDVDKAFNNALSTAKPQCAVFIDGMSLNDRIRLTTIANIEPLDFKVKEIHEHARRHIPHDWWNYYYGSVPYLFFKRDKIRRYSTIFFRKG